MSSRFIFIAGPCVIESKDLVFEVAGRLKEIVKGRADYDFYFKASFDKANRSAHDSFRGPGLEKGIEILSAVRKELEVKVITDVHLPEQCQPVAEHLDALQIPAFLCRQTDLIEEASKQAWRYKRCLNVKKGQFLAPWDMANVLEKVEAATQQAKPDWCWLTERGSTFGYNNLVVDMTSFPTLKALGVPAIFDATHSVQTPGSAAGGKVTGGRRQFIAPLARAAVAVGIDGLFMETHPRVHEAKSDAANAFVLADVPRFLDELDAIRQALRPSGLYGEPS